MELHPDVDVFFPRERCEKCNTDICLQRFLSVAFPAVYCRGRGGLPPFGPSSSLPWEATQRQGIVNNACNSFCLTDRLL